jgi:hypothetical protein
MDITCPYCSRPNPAQSVFCVGCGKNISQSGQATGIGTHSSLPTMPSQGSGPTEITPQPSYGSAPSSSFLNPAPSYPSSMQSQYAGGPNPPTYAPGGPSSSLPQPQYAGGPSASPPYPTGNFPTPPSQTQWSGPASAPPPPASQIGSAQAFGSLRRAFAGHGRLIMHHSWLLPGDQAQTMAVRHAIQTKIGQRNVPGVTIAPAKLSERGLIMEEREYLIAKRGVTSVFIYATPAGSDLYISRATTTLPAVSNIRVFFAVLGALIMFVGFIDRPSSETAFTNPGAFLLASFLNSLSFAILAVFIILLVRALIYWILEKDFLYDLRPRFINAFNIDDIMLLEHLTDDIVHSAVEGLGLDASKITPPPMGYEPKQRIRAI